MTQAIATSQILTDAQIDLTLQKVYKKVNHRRYFESVPADRTSRCPEKLQENRPARTIELEDGLKNPKGCATEQLSIPST